MSKEEETQKKTLERFSTYWYAPFCCVCLGCYAADFGSSGGTYELHCTLHNVATCFGQLYGHPLATRAQKTKITSANFILGQNVMSVCCTTHIYNLKIVLK